MLTTDTTVLVVVDVQGNLAHTMYEKQILFENLAKMVKGARVLNIPIILTEQNPTKLGSTIPEIAELLCGVEPLSKLSFSCCGDTVFLEQLAATKREQVLIAGIETHVCVYQTAMDLLERGYAVQIVADAVSSRTAHNREIGMERMKAEGIRLTSTEMALFELMRVAEGPQFKEMLKIVK